MKLFLILTCLSLVNLVQGQPRTDKSKTIVEVTDSNYIIISWKWKYKATHIVSEGYVTPGVKITKKNFHQYRHGIWKFYDYNNTGQVILTEEYYYGVKLGVYKISNYDGSWKAYTIVKQGNSSITFFDAKGKKTEEHVFDLNDSTKKVVKTFYNKSSDVIKVETWIDGKLVE